MIRLQNEVTQMRKRQQFLEECLIILLQKETSTSELRQDSHSLRPERSSEFPFADRHTAEEFFKSAEANPELFDKVIVSINIKRIVLISLSFSGIKAFTIYH
jgi:hypothetical protein